jgi:hypothetical protein
MVTFMVDPGSLSALIFRSPPSTSTSPTAGVFDVPCAPFAARQTPVLLCVTSFTASLFFAHDLLPFFSCKHWAARHNV